MARTLRLLTRMASTFHSSPIALNESHLLRNRSLVQLAINNNVHVAAALPKQNILNSNDLKTQQFEQRRYIWPFSKKAYNEMKFRQVEDLVVAKNSLILDCRRFDEVAKEGKIPYAEVVPVEELEEGFQLSPDEFQDRYGFKKPDKHDQIVVYCRTGKRAASASFALVHMGYDHVCRYEGSWQDWVNKNKHF